MVDFNNRRVHRGVFFKIGKGIKMATQRQLLQAYQRLERLLNRTLVARQNLSRIASEYTGKELHADICNDGEIEFRMTDARFNTQVPDTYSTIRIEELLNMKGGAQ